MPQALIAIVAFNTKAYWPRLRAALEAQTLRDFRVVVVDNASRPAERLCAADMPEGAELVQLERNVGFAAANNLAAARAEAEFLVCLNPDAFPAPDWLERLIGAARAAPWAGSVGSLQVSAEDEALLDGAGDVFWAGGLPYRSLYRKPRPARLGAEETFSACAAASLYRMALFREIGGFDERFFCYCEDVDFGFRLRLLGWPTLQADEAVVAHVGGGAGGGRSPFAVYHGTRNRMWTFVKNMPLPLLLALAPVHAALTLFVMAWSLFRGTAAPTWAGVGAGLAGLPAMLRARAALQAQRKASTGDIARALCWSPLAVLRRAPVRRAHRER